jgi:hypothetical protein
MFEPGHVRHLTALAIALGRRGAHRLGCHRRRSSDVREACHRRAERAVASRRHRLQNVGFRLGVSFLEGATTPSPRSGQYQGSSSDLLSRRELVRCRVQLTGVVHDAVLSGAPVSQPAEEMRHPTRLGGGGQALGVRGVTVSGPHCPSRQGLCPALALLFLRSRVSRSSALPRARSRRTSSASSSDVSSVDPGHRERGSSPGLHRARACNSEVAGRATR